MAHHSSPTPLPDTQDATPSALAPLTAAAEAGPSSLDELLPAAAAILRPTAIADEEIAAARLRHGAVLDEKLPEDGLSSLLMPSCEMARRPPVYRAHCRALLDRLAAGQDTAGPTDAELIVVLSRLSLAAPFNDTAFGLFLRIFYRTLPGLATAVFTDTPQLLIDCERVNGGEIDRLERKLRAAARTERLRPARPRRGSRPTALESPRA